MKLSKLKFKPFFLKFEFEYGLYYLYLKRRWWKKWKKEFSKDGIPIACKNIREILNIISQYNGWLIKSIIIKNNYKGWKR